MSELAGASGKSGWHWASVTEGVLSPWLWVLVVCCHWALGLLAVRFKNPAPYSLSIPKCPLVSQHFSPQFSAAFAVWNASPCDLCVSGGCSLLHRRVTPTSSWAEGDLPPNLGTSPEGKGQPLTAGSACIAGLGGPGAARTGPRAWMGSGRPVDVPVGVWSGCVG